MSNSNIYLSRLKLIELSLLALLIFLPTKNVLAQAPLSTSHTLYKSQIDQKLTVKRVSILPIMDNVGGIYSRPLEGIITQWINDNHHWDHIPINSIGPVLSPLELEESPSKVKALAQNTETDVLLSTKITKGPQGVSLVLDLFLVSDGLLFSKYEERNSKSTDIKQIKNLAYKSLEKLFSKIPYSGLVLSRTDNKVTLNLGKRDGISEGKVVSVIQIIKLNRHPKFHFIINSEKEILGKIKILKVDETLSFGSVVTEIEKGAIQKNAKISGLDFVNYGGESLSLSQTTPADLSHRPDKQISFGKNAQAWVPKKPPTFGRVSAKLGLGNFRSTLSQTSENLNAATSIYPSVMLDGELWISSKYSMHVDLRQGILSAPNPKTGTTPTTLNMSLSSYSFTLGYNFRFDADIWGPKVELLGGFSTYKLFVDNVSNGLTTLSYSGLLLGLFGSFPVTKNKDWSVGVGLNFFLAPSLSESPGTSGSSSKNSINQFKFQVNKKMGVNLQINGTLDLEMYSSNFTGTGTRTAASSASQNHTTLSGGISYFF